MDGERPRDLIAIFESVPDPRAANALHPLGEILIIATLAVICGAESWTEVEQFGHARHDWLKEFLELPHGIPSHDTFGRVFSMIDVHAFEQCFQTCATAMAVASMDVGKRRVIALDGKTLRRSMSAGKSPLHMVSAWCDASGLVLGQVAVDEKSNEITALPALLQMLDVKDAVVTIDAMGCQKDIAQKIIQRGGDYMLALKENQKSLHEHVKFYFDQAIAQKFDGLRHAFCATVDADHGRLETRRCWATSDVKWLAQQGQDWHALCGIVCVESRREVFGQDKGPSVQRRYFITSIDPHQSQASQLLDAVRRHWGVENRLHWSLDVSFREDACRVRIGHAAANFSRLRRLALNLLRREKSIKVGVQAKRLRCGWDAAYLLKVLTQAA